MSSPAPRRAGLSGLTWRGKLALALSMVPVGLLVAELGARGIALSRGRPTSPTALQEEIVRAASALVDDLPGATQLEDLEFKARSHILPHPYTAWDTLESQQVSRQLIDSYASDEPRQRFVVVVVGGSVAGVFASQNGGSWKFEQALEADPRFAGLDVVVYSQGRGSWKQPQQLILMAYLITRGVEPDLVINLDGFNEVALASYNQSIGGDPIYPSIPQWNGMHQGGEDPAVQAARERSRLRKLDAARIAERGASGMRPYSVLLTELTLRDLRELARAAKDDHDVIVGPGSESAQQRAVRGRASQGGPAVVVAEAVRAWMRASLALDVLCRANGIRYLHVLQPTLHDPGSKLVSDEERRRGKISNSWRMGVQIGYPLMRERGAELTSAGVEFLDASRLFEGDSRTLYYDSCHFGKEGNVLLATAMAERFLADLPPGPVERRRSE